MKDEKDEADVALVKMMTELLNEELQAQKLDFQPRLSAKPPFHTW